MVSPLLFHALAENGAVDEELVDAMTTDYPTI